MKVAKFEFSLFGINTYIVVDESTKKCAIIDPGMINAEEDEAMINFIRKNDLTVTHVINTHLHVDHAIGDKRAAELFNVPVLAHKDDEFLGARMKQQAQMFGIGERVDDVSITSYLTDGEKIKIGNGELIVLHVPGHSPGGIALYDPRGGFVIAGDSLFANSIGRTDLPGGKMDTLINSVKDKLLTLPEDTVVFPGHGPATRIEREKKSNPYLI